MDIRLIIYLIGIPIGYLCFRHYYTKICGLEWTIGLRRFGFVVSLMSLVNVIVWLIMMLGYSGSKDNKKANW